MKRMGRFPLCAVLYITKNAYYNRSCIISQTCILRVTPVTPSVMAIRTMESPTSLTHGAYSELRSQLLACHFEPGEQLKIDDLCRRFAVRSNAVRADLSRLA